MGLSTVISRRLRGWAAAAVVVVASGALAACGASGSPDGTGTPGPSGTGAFGGVPATTALTGSMATKPPTTAPPADGPPGRPLTCAKVRNAKLGSAAVPFNGYRDYIPLLDGIWAGEDGNSVELQECAIGDLNGDGAADGIASILLSGAGTGRFYSLGVWRSAGGSPVFTALLELGDRNPVESIAVAGNKATVVYLTRTDDQPLAALNIRRTAIFHLSGATLIEESHTDAPYTP